MGALTSPRPSRVSDAVLRLHEHSIAHKTGIIFEHFRENIAHLLGGQAKAMVVICDAGGQRISDRFRPAASRVERRCQAAALQPD